MVAAQAPSATARLLQEAATSLDVEARRHKHAAAYHRRQAQEVRQRLARLQATCDALGIALVVTPQDDGHSPEGTDR